MLKETVCDKEIFTLIFLLVDILNNRKYKITVGDGKPFLIFGK